MKPIIKVDNLGKQYRIGLRAMGYSTLRESLVEAVRGSLKHLRRTAPPADETIWALKDVNFEIEPGEAVGIIGRNGAGKSTLLKILSRITEPTTGRVELYGRVGSLLEVGTGFHPELTGRENVYLNGAILGMRKAEIDSKFDEIVAFAEIEKFLDTAVKRYSSGMYVRLAFGVAAHLNPEVLVIDEVLAVGDSAFQKKCLGKMKDVTRDGRTVIFVSHNVGAIQQLCTRAILLNEGMVVMDGSPQSVVSGYLSTGMEQMGERVWEDLENAPGDECARLRAVRVTDVQGNVCTMFDVRDPITIELEYTVLQDQDWLEVSLYLYNDRGDIIFASIDDVGRSELSEKRTAGNYKSACHIPPDFLNNGQMFVLAALTDEKRVHTIERDVVSFTINDAMNPTGARARSRGEWPFAAVRPKLEWRVDWTPDTRPKYSEEG